MKNNLAFYILEILNIRTDEKNTLNTKNICEILRNDYGIICDQRTAKTAICSLRDLGYPIGYAETIKNGKSFKSNWFIAPTFSKSEKTAIAAAVNTSILLNDKEKSKTLKKLGIDKGDCKNLLTFTHIPHCDETELQKKIETVTEAINERKMLSFAVIEYREGASLCLFHSCNTVKRYLIKPLKLLFYPNNVFLFCELGDSGNYRYFRLSTLYDITLTKNDFFYENNIELPLPINEAECENMELSSRERAVLMIDRKNLSRLLYTLGEAAKIKTLNESSAEIEVLANFSMLKEIIMQYGSSIEVLSPTKLRRWVALELRSAAGKYGEIKRLRGPLEPQS